MNNVEWTVLGLLADGRQTGYDILRVFKTSPAVPWRSSSGSVYPALKHLVRQGLAAPVTAGHAASARGAQAYDITPAGRATFRQWLESPVTKTLPEATTEVLLRLLFTHHAADGTVARLLKGYKEAVQAALEQVDAAMKTCPPACSPQQRYCMLNGQLALQAQLKWVNQAARALG